MSVRVVVAAKGNAEIFVSTPQVTLSWKLERSRAVELTDRICAWLDDETEFELPLDGRTKITNWGIESENLVVEDESWWNSVLMELHSMLDRCLGVAK